MKISIFKSVKVGRALLNKDEAIKVGQEDMIGKQRTIYTFKCAEPMCEQNIRVRSDALNRASGFCQVHAHRKRPFESIYNGIYRDHRKLKVSMSYEEYLEFTQIKTCHYCDDVIPWEPYATVKGTYKSRAYFLDRKDLTQGYSKTNCVTCCTNCNILRSNKFSYEEFTLLGSVLKQIRLKRIVDEIGKGGVCGS